MSNDTESLRDQLRRTEAVASAAQREQLAIAGLHERKAALIRAEVDHDSARREHGKLDAERQRLAQRIHSLECPNCSNTSHPIN